MTANARWLTNLNWLRVAMVLVIAALLWGAEASPLKKVAAAGPEEDLARITTNIEQALTAARQGDLVAAQKAYKAYDDAWFDIEDGVKAKSKDTYRLIEQKMSDVNYAFSKTPPVAQEVITALEALNATNKAFIGGSATAPSPTVAPAQNSSPATIATLLDQITAARESAAKGDFATAAALIKQFQDTWLDVEGQVKTRSAEAYSQTENDMALALNLLNQKSPEAKNVLDRLYTRLEPYKNNSSYGIADAMFILLREGLEALLVVVALLAFLKKSGNAEKQVWIWGGVGAGLAVSILLAVMIQLIFTSAINSSNREMIEGITGLVAAVMLLYVSYWMHSKASATAWQDYIKKKSTAALAKGSLFGLGLLSFLAIFREGAETALFYLGIGPSISTGDLLIGLGLGTIVLVGLGVLMLVVGLRIPMGPFFTVASLLVFFLCFKFVGMGIHALQVGKVLAPSSATYLPENNFLGLFPDWQTTGAQLILLAVGVGVWLFTRFKELPARPKEATPARVAK